MMTWFLLSLIRIQLFAMTLLRLAWRSLCRGERKLAEIELEVQRRMLRPRSPSPTSSETLTSLLERMGDDYEDHDEDL